MEKGTLQITIGEVVNAPVGTSKEYELEGSLADEEDMHFPSPFLVNVVIINADEGIWVKARVQGEVELICSRCAKSFVQPLDLTFDRLYGFHPNGEQLTIGKDMTVDLVAPLREELLVSLPIKRLCNIKCEGLLS